MGLNAQFAAAKRTAREREHVLSRVDSTPSQTTFNYARLGQVVLERLLDGRGNWLVHGYCAREHLGVSNTWLETKHRQAVAAAKAPTIVHTKSYIAASPHADALIDRIIRPATCHLSVTQ